MGHAHIQVQHMAPSPVACSTQKSSHRFRWKAQGAQREMQHYRSPKWESCMRSDDMICRTCWLPPRKEQGSNIEAEKLLMIYHLPSQG